MFFRHGHALCLVFILSTACGAWGADKGAPCKGLPAIDKYCGVFAVRDVCAAFGMDITWETAVRLVQPREDGSNSIEELMKALNRMGLVAVPLRCGFGDLERFGCPSILRFSGESPAHFVACLGAGGDGFTIIDTIRPPREYKAFEFSRLWDGEAIVVAGTMDDLPLRVRELDGISEYVGQRRDEKADPRYSAPLSKNGVTFDYGLIDFGVMGRFSSQGGSFPFRVTGEKEFRIGSVRTSCRCIADLEYPRSVPAGGQGEIRFTLEQDGKVGDQTRMLYVIPDDDSLEPMQLTILYNLKPDIWLNRTTVDFGIKAQGSHQALPVSIVNVARGTGMISAIECDESLLKVSEPVYTEPCFLASSFQVSVHPDARLPRFSTEIKVRFEGAEDFPVVIPVTGGIRQAVSVRPDMLCFGVLSDQALTRKAKITVHDLALLSSDGRLSVQAPECIDVNVTQADSGVFLLEATLTPDRARECARSGRDDIRVVLENGEVFALPCTYSLPSADSAKDPSQTPAETS